MLIICGKTASGKTTVGKEMEKQGMKRVVTFTTRPPRKDEVDGIDYNFLTQEEFDARKAAGFFAETADYDASFGHCSYGSAKEDYENGDDSFIILNPYGIGQVLANTEGTNGRKPIIVYLNAANDVILQRLRKRGDDIKEVRRRMKADDIDFCGISNVSDITVDVNDETDVSALAAFLCGLGRETED